MRMYQYSSSFRKSIVQSSFRDGDATEEAHGGRGSRVHIPDMSRAAQVKVGDRVLGYWEETMDWYPGRVTCVKQVRGRDAFEVEYDPDEDGASDTSTNGPEGVRHLLPTGDEAAA